MSFEDLLPCPQKRRKTIHPGRKQTAITLTSAENTANVNRMEQDKNAELQRVTIPLTEAGVKRKILKEIP
jgi:hypothetical protein